MTPADLRALAERVGTDTNTNPSGLQRLVCRALGYNLDYQPPNFLHDLNAIAAAWEPLRAKGWRISIDDLQLDSAILWEASACKSAAFLPVGVELAYEEDTYLVARAPTEPRARLSLLLRCMAAEMEAAQ